MITGSYNYFTCSGQGGPSTHASGPSTHGSGVYHEPEVEEEENIAPPPPLAQVDEDVHVEEDNTEENAHVQEGNDEEINGEEVEGITEFNPDYIISNPGLRIPIDRFAPNIRDEVRRAFIAKGPTQPMVIYFRSHMIRGAFKNIGSGIIVGWNTVWRRTRLIASIVTFSNMIRWMISFVMMHLEKLASHSGGMCTWHFQNMLVDLIAYTMLQQQHSMIFVTKGQV